MRKPASSPAVVVPPICVAINDAITDSGYTNRAIAAMLNTSEQNIGRWRKNVEPSMSLVSEMEKALDPNRAAGWLFRKAGYVEDVVPLDEVGTIRASQRLNEGYRKIVLRTLKEGMKLSKEESALSPKQFAMMSASRRR